MSLTPAELAVIRQNAQESLIGYAEAMWPGYAAAAHHHLIARKLEAVARGEIRRLIISMPPRHGKSMEASEFFPAWFLGLNPSREIIAATYAQDLADDFGRKVRNLCNSPQHQTIFPGFYLAQDSKSVSRFHTPQRGVYNAVGVGGPGTGRGAFLLLIDDPIKGREDAESETMRKRLKDWYTSVARTRLMPGGSIVIIQCMTGDTPVMRPDGSETPLRDLRLGDAVASYEFGALSESRVLNWKNNGPDQVFEIRTISGKIVRANGRHPFLVRAEDGGESWVRTTSLRPGQNMLLVKKASGRGRLAVLTNAVSPSSAVDIVLSITSRFAGLMAIGRRLLIRKAYATGILNIATASASQNTTKCLSTKAAYAPSARNHPTRKTLERTGASSCALTIATKKSRCAAFCVMTATLRSAMAKLRKPCSLPLNTYEITTDTIAEITYAGVEDVFDIQIERTENFIANGLVSHNTRWHEDDLAGWLVREHKHESWEVLSLPALAEEDDPLGRKVGEALWPECYPVEELEKIRRSIGTRDWTALYQQRPAPVEGGLVKIPWFRRYMTPPAHPRRVIQSWDTAMKAGDVNDPSCGQTWSETETGYYKLDNLTKRMEYPDLKRAILSSAEKWNPSAIIIEDKASGQSVIQDLRTTTNLPIIPIEPKGDKVVRLLAVSALIEAGRAWLPESAPWMVDFEAEIAAFPNGRHDDQVDAMTQALTYLSTGGGRQGLFDYMREMAAGMKAEEQV